MYKNCAGPMRLEISFVIPTFNRPWELVNCLESVFSQKTGIGFEVIVSLDSRDNVSQEFLAGYGRSVSIVCAGRPGLNAGRNKGITVAQGKIIVFLDDDCVIPRPDWIDLLDAGFRRRPEAFAIGGGFISRDKAPLFVRCRNRMSNAYVLDSRVSGDEVYSLLGGNIAYRMEVFTRFGHFDEFLLYGATETELNERLSAAGKKLYFLDELSVVHAVDDRSLYQHCRQAFLQGRGRAYSYSKGNKCVYTGRGVKATTSYLRAIVAEERSLIYKIGAFVFLILNIFCYRIGFHCGRIRYNRL